MRLPLSINVVRSYEKKHAPAFDGSCFKIAPHLSKDECGTITSAFSILVGFGTLQCRLPWFHRAVPSTTLDKVFSYQGFATLIITDIPLPCQRLPLSFFNKKSCRNMPFYTKIIFLPSAAHGSLRRTARQNTCKRAPAS